ncbi:hypothetical protein D5R40_18980 [Okeania hirsuta]|uniref:Uncharacterized protein n=1 Tax=Okeania hirsuta TaxID=1458930 RepID=A0A3N6QFM3_9CYAN|nr:hypothetical protein D4Z78_20935 [Okeania hirsuta]RQH36692.1 hypothetical protein D5R40_18980 [Okeania hirsuta]
MLDCWHELLVTVFLVILLNPLATKYNTFGRAYLENLFPIFFLIIIYVKSVSVRNYPQTANQRLAVSFVQR